MKINETSICPDLDCNEVFHDTGKGCPKCLSSEGIPLSKIFSTIEELARITKRTNACQLPFNNGLSSDTQRKS